MKKFVRTRGSRPPSPPATPAPAKTNGHANGVGARRDDQHSTLSRYWSGSQECGAGLRGSGAGPALWEDPDFPPARALGDKRQPAVQWLRPYDLCANPSFFGEEAVEAERASGGSGASAGEQGAYRWRAGGGPLRCGALAAASGALAAAPRLLARAAPPHSFRVGYTGRFRFHFWVWSEWREVAVDDRLPTRAGRLLGCRPAGTDFTLPLLEKAYAKLYGSYRALRGLSVSLALGDVSGGVVQSFPLRPRRLALRVLHSAAPRSTLLVAVAATQPAHKHDPDRSLGLIGDMPYCVTGLARLRGADEAEEAGALVRLRGPGAGAGPGLGQGAGAGGWRGAWGPHSAELAGLPPADRRLLAANSDEFWMSFSDFCTWFSRLELVHVGPDDWLREPALRSRRPWRAVLARRRWRRGYNAGGPPAAPTANANPQFHVQVSTKCHVVVAVAQEYCPETPRRLHAVGFVVYELPAGVTRVGDLAALRPLDVTHESRAREVATFFTLPAGRYLVVPHTRRAHTEAAFLLRLLTDEHADVWELNEDNALLRDVWRELAARLPPAPARAGWLDAAALRRLLRPRAGRELCRALVALRDAGLRGRVAAHELPALAALLAGWRAALAAESEARACRAPRLSAYRLRRLLWAVGVSASNKVVECLVLRFARGLYVPHDAALLALARLHLAHERYRSLDTKLKSNPLSLEEMILMTIYS